MQLYGKNVFSNEGMHIPTIAIEVITGVHVRRLGARCRLNILQADKTQFVEEQ